MRSWELAVKCVYSWSPFMVELLWNLEKTNWNRCCWYSLCCSFLLPAICKEENFFQLQYTAEISTSVLSSHSSHLFSHHRSMRLKTKKRRVGWLIRKCTSLTRKWNRKPGLCRANWKNLLRKPSKLLYLTTDNLRFQFKIEVLTKCYYMLNNRYNLIKGAKCLRNCGANFSFSFSFINWVSKLTFQALALCQSQWRRTDAQNISVETLYSGQFTFINSVDHYNLS